MRKVFAGIVLFLLTFTVNAQERSAQLFLKKQQTLSERWELERKYHKGIFIITPYKPVFVTAGRWSSNPNTKPTSENPLYTLPFEVDYNKYEAKFQFSLKTKLIYGLLKGRADLWAGYTQKAHWQIYNAELSRPFRELNYEPEIILNFPIHFKFLGLTGKMAGIAFNHQSNGRSLPLSRSWNRIIGHLAVERNNWYVMLRGWYRLKDEDDENPAVADFTGRAEGVFVYNLKSHQLSLQILSALRPKNPGRGSFLFSYIFPVMNNFRLQFQLGSGYGETLMDYNHRQTTIGISASLIDW